MKLHLLLTYIATGLLLASNIVFILLWFYANGTIDNGDSNNEPNLNQTQLKLLLNHIPMKDLVDIYENVPELSTLITNDIMISKYRIHEKLIQFDGGEASISHNLPDELQITGHKLIEKVLKYFGFAITKLRINNTAFNRSQLDPINALINDVCWESLKTLEYHGIHVNPFVNWKHFDSITDLTIKNVFLLSSDKIEIHDIFPNVKDLVIYAYPTTNLSFIAHNFHQLEHFKLRSREIVKENLYFNRFLEENPQIQSIDLDSSLEFIQRVEEKLTNLQKLRLKSSPRDFYSSENCAKKLHFPNVKEFSLTVHRDEHVNAECIPFVFDKLTILELNMPRITDKWIEFVKQHKHLKSIRLPETEPTYDQLTKLVIDDVKELTEISVHWSDKGIGRQPKVGIVEIMKEPVQLKKIVIWSDQHTDPTNAFSEVFPKWKPSERTIDGERSFVTFSKI